MLIIPWQLLFCSQRLFMEMHFYPFSMQLFVLVLVVLFFFLLRITLLNGITLPFKCWFSAVHLQLYSCNGLTQITYYSQDFPLVLSLPYTQPPLPPSCSRIWITHSTMDGMDFFCCCWKMPFCQLIHL